ncbi:Protein of unknown function [Propionibacterium freudenreichii]|nr:Protein of unknown function [Propionibacterium freudenreichii]
MITNSTSDAARLLSLMASIRGLRRRRDDNRPWTAIANSVNVIVAMAIAWTRL